MTRHQEMQRIIRNYREVQNVTEWDMHEVVRFAVKMGFPLPKPLSAIDRLAKEFSQAAREEVRHDKKTGRPYRANHAYKTVQGTQQMTFWVDIDEAPRPAIVKCFVQRREQTVGDVVQLSFDAEHWNRMNPKEEPIVIPTDFTDDVEWRKNAPDEKAS